MVAALRLCTATAGARYGRIPPSAPISSRASTASASVTTRSARTHNSPAPPREAAARLSICPFVGARLSPVRLGNGFLPRVFKNFLPRPASLATTRGHTDLTTTCTMGKKKEMVKGAADGWTLESTGMEAPGGRNHRPDLNVVLVTPEIPGNTGSVARSCAATAVGMHLIEPLGFEIDDTKLKRAGLDYWPYVVVKVHKSFEAFLEFFDGLEEEKRLVAFSARAEISYRRSGAFKKGDWLLFGAETTGLPKEVVDLCQERDPEGGLVKIPIITDHVRSLNMAVACGVGIFEAIRQLDEAAGVGPDGGVGGDGAAVASGSGGKDLWGG